MSQTRGFNGLFRICGFRRFGAQVNKSLQKLTVCDDERPVVIQIYGRDPGAMAEAAEIVVEKAQPDILDLNFGCPVKKVAGKGAGSGMLQTPELMQEIIRAVVDRVSSRVPVTVKPA